MEIILRKLFFLLTSFLILTLVLANRDYAYSQTKPVTGLRFSSHEAIKDQRTSLNLTPEYPFSISDGFSMEFDALFRSGDGGFGYVFRIIGDNKANIDLVSNLGSSATTFSLIFKEMVLFTFKWEDIPKGEIGSWIKVKLQLDKDSHLSVSLNGFSKKEKLSELADLQEFDIMFGSCKFTSFLSTDVSPMTVKNIRIYDGNQQILRNWELARHHQNYVYDELTQAKAVAHNPNWEINKHLEWKKERSFQISNLIGVAKDEENGRVFLVDKQAVYVCKMEASNMNIMETIHIDTLTYTKGNPFPCEGNQLIYNPLTNELWSYNFARDAVSSFNFKTRSWSLSEPDCPAPDLWHHSSFLSPTDTTLITFGGYGHFTYKSFFNSYNPNSEKWGQQNLMNRIPPRYMSAMGPLDKEKLLIFGGYGSKSGKQEVSPHFFHDLYSIDKKGLQPEKLWDLDSGSSPFVPCQALITDTTSNSFYTLIYNPVNFQTSLRLANYRIDKPKETLYADSIPYKFLDIKSWSTVFLNKKDSKLIAITTYDSEVDLYSLAYPPLLAEDVYQEELKVYSKLEIWSGILLLGFAFIVSAAFFISKKLAGKNDVKSLLISKAGEKAHSLDISQENQKVTTSSIYLLGGFQVFDKNGSDITSNFTPTLKQLFLLIFLSSVKEGKGISPAKLDEILWFDKTEESARNNRNVNISKLRVLFKNINHIDLEYNNTSWKISFGGEFYADYTEALQLINKSKSSAGLQEEEIVRLINIASWGELCPNIQTEWMDKFKVDFANELINTLGVLSTNIPEHYQNKSQLLCALSDCILKFDILNEEAITIKCATLIKAGKRTFAKQSYDLFCREYKQMLGIDFSLSFKELVNRK